MKTLENFIPINEYLSDQVKSGIPMMKAKVKLSNDLNVGLRTISRWEKSENYFIIEEINGIAAIQLVSKNHGVQNERA